LTDHARRLAANLGLRPPTAADLPLMIEAAAQVARRTDRGQPIAAAVVAALRDAGIILPTRRSSSVPRSPAVREPASGQPTRCCTA
jgi:hypothetical protein